MPSSLFRRRRKPEEQKSGIEPAALVVADASVVVTATIRAQKDARAQSAGGEAGKEKTSVVAPIKQCRQSRNRSAFVLIVSSVFVALATSLLMKQQQRLGGLVPDRISMILTRLERPSFFQQRRKVEEEESIGVVEDASASTPASTSASPAAADEEELAAQAREAAESATAASSGPSGFVTSEEWEEALLLAGGDDREAHVLLETVSDHGPVARLEDVQRHDLAGHRDHAEGEQRRDDLRAVSHRPSVRSARTWG